MDQSLVQPYSQPSAAQSAANTGIFLFGMLIVVAFLIFGILTIVGMWKTYKKAGQPGWAAIVPIYNMYIWLKIVGRPAWWLLLLFVPVVSLIVSLIMSLDLAKAFGKSSLFGAVGLWLFEGIGFLILGFGSAQYQGPEGGSGAAPAAPTGMPPANPLPPANPTPPAATPPTTPPAPAA